MNYHEKRIFKKGQSYQNTTHFQIIKKLETVNQAKERLSTEMENIKAEITRLKSNQDYE